MSCWRRKKRGWTSESKLRELLVQRSVRMMTTTMSDDDESRKVYTSLDTFELRRTSFELDVDVFHSVAKLKPVGGNQKMEMEVGRKSTMKEMAPRTILSIVKL